MSKRRASDVFVECLEAEGVRQVFGIPGEETLDLNESLADSTVSFIPVRHEQGGAYMADMVGRLTGRAGVCLGTLGPGATNLVTAVADAFLDRAPLGVRLDAGYNRFSNDDDFFFDDVGGFDCQADFGDDRFDCDSDPQMWYINFNGKLRYPFRWDHRGAHVYLTGGATWNRFRRFAFVDDDFRFGDRDFIVLATDDWNHKWGGNVGGGVSFGWGNTSVYLESRYQTMNIGNTTQSYVPLVLGITF